MRAIPAVCGAVIGLAVKRGVHIVDVLFTQAVLGQTQSFAEVSNLSKGHSALEPQGIPAFFIG